MNPKINIKKTEILSDSWSTLKRITFDYQKKNGAWETHTREAYDRGNGAAILLYNRENQTVILTRQFRMPTYLNGNATGMMIEACAGVLEQRDPEEAIKKEVEEETGYRISQVRKVFEAYMSPGSVTEILHFFTAEYSGEMKIHSGGGIEQDQEDIEVLEVPFEQALQMMENGGIKDGKTIMLLQYAKIHNLI